MIEPVQRGEALMNDIQSTQVEAGEVAIWWLGQSGYAIKTVSMLFYIDLYLSEHLTAKYANTEKPHTRMTEAPLHGGDIRGAEWVFASHKHSDHLDPGTVPSLFAASPDAKLILPMALVEHAVSMGVPEERLIPTRGEETFSIGSMVVHSIPSAHPNFDYDETSGYPFLGYGFQVDGVTLYHSGDTLAYDGLAGRLQRLDADILFLPINGNAAPGTPPNMNITEAVELAKQVKPRLVIPHHYDMFTFNTADVSQFVTAATAEDVPHRVLQCGERFVWRK